MLNKIKRFSLLSTRLCKTLVNLLNLRSSFSKLMRLQYVNTIKSEKITKYNIIKLLNSVTNKTVSTKKKNLNKNANNETDL